MKIEAKSDAMNKLRLGLVRISGGNDHPRTPTNCVHTDDLGLDPIIDQLANIHIESDKMLRVGLTVGNGLFLSMLPEIPADCLITIDRNPFVSEWNQYTADIAGETDGIMGYMNSVYSTRNPLFRESVALGINLTRWFRTEMIWRAPLHHFLVSNRLPDCQRALVEKSVMTVTLDLQKTGDVTAFRDLLNILGAEITFANLTSLWEWEAQGANGQLQPLKILPFHPKAAIIFSSRYRCEEEQDPPTAIGICRGYADYLNQAGYCAGQNLFRALSGASKISSAAGYYP